MPLSRWKDFLGVQKLKNLFIDWFKNLYTAMLKLCFFKVIELPKLLARVQVLYSFCCHEYITGHV